MVFNLVMLIVLALLLCVNAGNFFYVLEACAAFVFSKEVKLPP
jgi:hypothetical protein